jgi:hypothetical protein
MYSDPLKPTINGSYSPVSMNNQILASSADAPVLHSVPPQNNPERNLPLVGELQPSVSNRLVVLVPAQDLDSVNFSRDIWTFAMSKKLDVVLLTIARDAEEMHTAQLRLVTIGAMIRDPFVQVDTEVVHSRSWIKAAKKIVRENDVFLCPSELTFSIGWGKRRALSEVLNQGIKMPVYTMAGYIGGNRVNWSRIFRQAFYWMVLLAIFAGFFKVETSVDLIMKGTFGQLIEFLLVLTEVGAIYFWTSVIG